MTKEELLPAWADEVRLLHKRQPIRNFLQWSSLVLAALLCFTFARSNTISLSASAISTIVERLSGTVPTPEHRAHALLSRQPIIGMQIFFVQSLATLADPVVLRWTH